MEHKQFQGRHTATIRPYKSVNTVYGMGHFSALGSVMTSERSMKGASFFL